MGVDSLINLGLTANHHEVVRIALTELIERTHQAEVDRRLVRPSRSPAGRGRGCSRTAGSDAHDHCQSRGEQAGAARRCRARCGGPRVSTSAGRCWWSPDRQSSLCCPPSWLHLSLAPSAISPPSYASAPRKGCPTNASHRSTTSRRCRGVACSPSGWARSARSTASQPPAVRCAAHDVGLLSRPSRYRYARAMPHDPGPSLFQSVSADYVHYPKRPRR